MAHVQNQDTAIILGAGWSAAEGAPLMSDLGREVLRECTLYSLDSEPDYVKRYIHYRSRYEPIGLDVEDVESFVSIIREECRGRKKSWFEQSRFLRTLVREVICKRIYHVPSPFEVPHSWAPYGGSKEFVQHLFKYILDAKEKDIAIIVFNWDTLLEEAIREVGDKENYGIGYSYIGLDKDDPWKEVGGVPGGGRIKIIKPHGSFNFFWCEDCDVINPIAVVTNQGDISCTSCGRKLAEDDPFFLLPTWEKSPELASPIAPKSPTLPNAHYAIWKTICNVRKILIIGYSFPRSDIFFGHFVRSAIANRRFYRFLIVDPSQKTQDRYVEEFQAKRVLNFQDHLQTAQSQLFHRLSEI